MANEKASVKAFKVFTQVQGGEAELVGKLVSSNLRPRVSAVQLRGAEENNDDIMRTHVDG